MKKSIGIFDRFSTSCFRNIRTLALVGMAFLSGAASSATAATIYVNDTAAGLNSGANWGDAFNALQDGLAAAGAGDQIWVAEGVYVPGANETDTFQLKNGVSLYGGFRGFSGDEDNFGIRAPKKFLAILSGDINGDDLYAGAAPLVDNPAFITGPNSNHVVTGNGTDSTAVLNGFVITAGQADGSLEDFGGGMLNQAGSPTLAILTFSGNSAAFGAGLRSTDSNSQLFNIIFSGNSASFGGGMYNVDSDLAMTNVSFSGNTAVNGGGAMFNAGSSPTLTNATFADNSAMTGGAIYNESDSDPFLQNCILWGNTPSQITNFDVDSDPFVIGSLVEGGCPDAQTTCAGIMSMDPMFADADGLDDVAGTLDDDYRLALASPGVDAGANNADLDGGGPGNLTIGDIATDAAENPRIVDGDGNLTATVDLGAFESPQPILYVDDIDGGSNTGSDWANAFSNLQEALGYAVPGSQIWVAQGVYKPGALFSPAESFRLRAGVKVYGGFEGTPGTEGDFGTRDFVNFATILSGDIDDDDANLDGNNIAESVDDLAGINSIHVVTSDGLDPSAVLDGFILTAGQTESGGGDCVTHCGGGLFNQNGSPTLSNLIISGNRGDSGGGMMNADGSPLLTNILFSGNEAVFDGGGMRNNSGSPTLVNVVFSGNVAGDFGGGGMENFFFSHPTLINVTFSNNSANLLGGGIYNFYSSSATILNGILWGNSDTSGSGPDAQILNDPNAPIGYSNIEDSLIQGGCPSGATCEGALLMEDPLFEDANGPDNQLGTPDDDLRLTMVSPARNAGNNTHLPTGVTTDFAGEPRIADGTVDMGAYEVQQAPATETPTPTLTLTESPTPTTTSTPTFTNTIAPISTPTTTPTESPTLTNTPTATQSPSPTSIEPTATRNYDVQPQPVVDGRIDARDLLQWFQEVKDSSPTRDLLFDFSRFWQTQ